MPVIPITSGTKQAPAPAPAQPSEAAMLMALAEMHKQGRFDKPMNVLPYEQRSGKVGEVEGVDVKKELMDKGHFEGTPRYKGVPGVEGLY